MSDTEGGTNQYRFKQRLPDLSAPVRQCAGDMHWWTVYTASAWPSRTWVPIASVWVPETRSSPLTRAKHRVGARYSAAWS